MSLLLFEGAAGTGKTTRLLAAAREHISRHPLAPDQRVLALTKYHGSRRRMDVKLRNSHVGVGNAVDCLTIDSFARNLVMRWRSLASHLDLHPGEDDFGAIASAAGVLLHRPEVGQWVARRYPLVVVDEAQDCKGGEIAILSGLHSHVRMLCCGDHFQDLSGNKDNEAIRWASEAGEVIPLVAIHRTHVPALLEAALSFRNGGSICSEKKPGFEVVPVRSSALGGAVICWRIKYWASHGQIALISGTAPGTSPFCDEAVDWASTKAAKSSKSSKKAGPFPIEWENDDAAVQRALLQLLKLPTDPREFISCHELAAKAEKQGIFELRDWSRRQHFVRGQSAIAVSVVEREVADIVRRRRAYGPERDWSRRAMTIHQAKNREFESVIVLWPLRMADDPEQKRRLLYNAVTRARGRAVVIVQDPKGKVMGLPPFTAG